MLLRREDARAFPIPHCHGGAGTLSCHEYLGDYARADAGFTFVHESILPPDAGIGEHRHEGDEEIYFILKGRGELVLDGVPYDVTAGDLCITRSGETHSLRNVGDQPLSLLVVGTNLNTRAREM